MRTEIVEAPSCGLFPWSGLTPCVLMLPSLAVRREPVYAPLSLGFLHAAPPMA